MEWRFNPLVVDVNGDGFPDLVATARVLEEGYLRRVARASLQRRRLPGLGR
jgi:hypothetical protein